MNVCLRVTRRAWVAKARHELFKYGNCFSCISVWFICIRRRRCDDTPATAQKASVFRWNAFWASHWSVNLHFSSSTICSSVFRLSSSMHIWCMPQPYFPSYTYASAEHVHVAICMCAKMLNLGTWLSSSPYEQQGYHFTANHKGIPAHTAASVYFTFYNNSQLVYVGLTSYTPQLFWYIQQILFCIRAALYGASCLLLHSTCWTDFLHHKLLRPMQSATIWTGTMLCRSTR